MIIMRGLILASSLATAALIAASFSPEGTTRARDDLDKNAEQVLAQLYASHPDIEAMGKKARAVLVFPRLGEAGIVFGVRYGMTAIIEKSAAHTSFIAMAGLRALPSAKAAGQDYAYVVFIMSRKAMKHIDRLQGLDIGIGPGAAVVDPAGVPPLAQKQDAYAFVVDQDCRLIRVSVDGFGMSMA